jgi:hypothetical protein
MSTVNHRKGGIAGFPADRPRVATMSVLLDCALLGTLTAADVHQIVDVPAGKRVVDVVAETVRPDTGASTRVFDVGDVADPNGYLAAVTAKSAAGTLAAIVPALTEAAPNTVTGYSFGKTYLTAGVISLIPTQDLTDGAWKIHVTMVDLVGTN